MAKRKTYTPTDPAEIARRRQEERRDPSKWGVSYEAMILPANSDVGMEEATRTKVQRIQRYDCFALLHVRGSLPSASLVAVRRLQDDWAVRMGTTGATTSDGAPSGSTSRAHVSDRSLEAANNIERVAELMREDVTKLLEALITPTAITGSRVNWRGVVQALTGEHRPRQQVQFVVGACDALAEAYRQHDNTPRRKAA